MKITIFTSNDLRHINLINKLAKISTKCFAIVEGKTLFPGKVDDFFKKTKLMKKYFANVKHAEKKFFSSNLFINENVNCKLKPSVIYNYIKRAQKIFRCSTFSIFNLSMFNFLICFNFSNLMIVNLPCVQRQHTPGTPFALCTRGYIYSLTLISIGWMYGMSPH